MLNKILLLIFLLCPGSLFSCSSNVSSATPAPAPERKQGYVVGIIDGDTYDLLLENKTTISIRMNGIDAPEKGMLFYQASKKYLSGLCFNKNVIYVQTDIDVHKRIVAKTYLEDASPAGMAYRVTHFCVYPNLVWPP